MKNLRMLVLLVPFIAGLAWGDGMAIPYLPRVIPAHWASFLPPNPEAYDPLRVRVYEPRQAAVILFNGSEEILVLSIELAASEPTGVLEIVPLPSKPKVKLGNIEKMGQLEQLLIEKNRPRPSSPPGTMGGGPVPGAAPAGEAARVARSARIAFTAKLGAHDLKAVEVMDIGFFSRWVMQFMESQQAVRAAVTPEFAGIVDNYLKRDFRWFVFDSIAITTDAKGRQPIEYRFASDRIFYPLEISSLQQGQTSIDLLVVTAQRLRNYDVRYRREIDWGLEATIKQTELARISGGWASFMKVPEVYLQMLTLSGNLKDFQVDLVAKLGGVI